VLRFKINFDGPERSILMFAGERGIGDGPGSGLRLLLFAPRGARRGFRTPVRRVPLGGGEGVKAQRLLGPSSGLCASLLAPGNDAPRLSLAWRHGPAVSPS
jgi:hypothetical protein